MVGEGVGAGEGFTVGVGDGMGEGVAVADNGARQEALPESVSVPDTGRNSQSKAAGCRVSLRTP